MSVVAFERKPVTGVWSESELNAIVAALSAALAPATGRQWETGTTEKGDAQFYLLGPLPDQACQLCLSRIGRQYVDLHRQAFLRDHACDAVGDAVRGLARDEPRLREHDDARLVDLIEEFDRAAAAAEDFVDVVGFGHVRRR